MNRTYKWMTSIILLTTMLFGFTLQGYADTTLTDTLIEDDFRGVWVATVLNIDYPKTGTTDVEALKTQALTILDRAQANGLNAVILQVRPTGDAFYKSKIFHWSKY